MGKTSVYTIGIASVLLAVAGQMASATDPPAGPATTAAATQPAGSDASVQLVRPLLARFAAADGPEQRQLIAAALAHDGGTILETGVAALLETDPTSAACWGLWVELALAQGRYATALERCQQAPAAIRQSGALSLRAARACCALGRALGTPRLCRVPHGRPGQFVGDVVLVERRSDGDQFLACPADSGFYQLRRALDAGIDDPLAHVLYAQAWLKLGRPQVGWQLLEARAADLLDPPTAEVLDAYCALALAADELPAYLRYARMRARLAGDEGTTLLADAYCRAAERYAQRGNAQLQIEWLRRAAALRPACTAVLLLLADAEWDAGEQAAAIAGYRRVLQLDDAHPERNRLRQRIAAASAPTK